MQLSRLPIQLLPKSAVTIGSFDGVHLGHQQIVRRLTEYAGRHQLRSVVVTFEPQPREFLQPEKAPARLSSLTDKTRLLAPLGVDQLVVLPFNSALRSLSAEEFVQQILIERLNTQWLQVGDDFRFGADRRGNLDFLKQQTFEVSDLPTQLHAGKRISSTQVREALHAANFKLAETLLGVPYKLSGRVVYGRQLGRTIGVPTANILLPHSRLACDGVFVVSAKLSGKRVHGVANLGAKPTVGDSRFWLESHFFDFDESLYGQRITIELRHRLRGVETFDSLDALKHQIQQDMQAAKAWLTNNGN